MTRGREENGLLELECGNNEPEVVPRFAEEIGCAARSDVPVLVTGAPEEGQEIACAIDRRSRAPIGKVEVVDCRQNGAFGRVMSYVMSTGYSARAHRSSILLLQEVHALSLNEQLQLDHRLGELRGPRRTRAVRIVASSSTPLFERVREGSFDERLYYRLNIISMVVG